MELATSDGEDLLASALNKILEKTFEEIRDGCEKCNLHSYYIGDEGAASLGMAIDKTSKLVELNLRNCGIGPVGIAFLAEELKRCSSLRILILGDARHFQKKLADIVREIGYTSSGIALSSGCTGLAAHGLAKVANPCFKRSSTVSKCFGSIRANLGCVAISAILGIGTYLISEKLLGGDEESADVSGTAVPNNLASLGTRAIAEVVRTIALERLDIAYCNVLPDAMTDLIEADKSKGTLKWICLKGNSELKKEDCRFKRELKVEL